MRNILYFICLALVIGSCNDIENHVGDMNIGSTIPLRFDIEQQSNKQVDFTKSNTYDEYDIRTADILVFDQSGNYIERVKCDDVTIDASGDISFYASITETTEPRTLHVFTTAHDASDDFVQGFDSYADGTYTNESSIVELLMATNNTSISRIVQTTMNYYVAWASVDVPNINSSTQVPQLRLVRSVASIEAVVESNPSTANFTLLGIAPTKMSKLSFVTTPHIDPITGYPTEINYPNQNIIDFEFNRILSFDDDIDTIDSKFINPSDHSKGVYADIYPSYGKTYSYGTQILIYGEYDGKPCYYKLDPIVTEFIRNHRYRYTIKSVEGPGYSTAEGAINNPPADVQVAVNISAPEYDDIVTNGQQTFALTNSQTHIILPRSVSTSAVFKSGIVDVYANGGSHGLFQVTYLQNTSSPLGFTDSFAPLVGPSGSVVKELIVNQDYQTADNPTTPEYRKIKIVDEFNYLEKEVDIFVTYDAMTSTAYSVDLNIDNVFGANAGKLTNIEVELMNYRGYHELTYSPTKSYPTLTLRSGFYNNFNLDHIKNNPIEIVLSGRNAANHVVKRRVLIFPLVPGVNM